MQAKIRAEEKQIISSYEETIVKGKSGTENHTTPTLCIRGDGIVDEESRTASIQHAHKKEGL